ncbi:MAG TPA: DUF2279 domain-containing protein [Bacteroidales bacterium]|nr:DUF2279 domain-containing protein [Bacteroidales bacterium]
MKRLSACLILIIVLHACAVNISAQDISARRHWLIPSDTLHKPRLRLVLGTTTVGYVATFYGLNDLWYKGYPRSDFHWIDDGGEWLQLDKAGHMITPYQTSRLFAGTLRWAGVEPRKAALYGGLAMFMVSNTIEVFDGFSAQWGASGWDIAANFAGAGLMTAQELLWEEQRISLKVSLTFIDYPAGPLHDRARHLYGASVIQRAIKDYNSINIWLSVNPASFGLPMGRFGWLNFAAGYSIDNVYGGYNNKWTDKNGQYHDFSHLKRTRQLYLSPDIDFSRIRTNSPGLKTLFQVLNVFKVPAPALELNTRGELNWHWLR